MPALPNESSPFRGKVNHSGYAGYTWVGYPHVENPASLDMDPMGRLFVAEANRFWFGVPDLRRAREMIREDFQARTIEDRLAMDNIPVEERLATDFALRGSLALLCSSGGGLQACAAFSTA